MNLTALLSELAIHPGAILAWQVDEPREPLLSVFQVEGGTRQLAYMTVTREQRASITAELTELGHVQGSYASMTGLVWRVRDRAFTVWGDEGRVFHTDGRTLDFATRSIPFEPTMHVIAFVDEDFVDRGVRIRTSGGEQVVALHVQLRASMDWSYGALDALSDSGWTLFLGRELADFLSVAFIDETG